MTGAPAPVDARQLSDVHIELDPEAREALVAAASALPADDEDDEVTDLTGAATAAAGQGAKRKAPLLRQAPLLRLDRPVEQRRVLGGGWLYGAHRVRENMARQKTS